MNTAYLFGARYYHDRNTGGNFAKTCIKQDKKFLGVELDKNIFDYCINNINEVKK